VPHRIILSWYTGRWWVGCYIWYSEEGLQPAQAPPRCTRSNSPPINGQCTNHHIVVYGPLLCGFSVPIKGLTYNRHSAHVPMIGWRFILVVTRWSRSTYSTLGPVSAWIGDCLLMGKLSRYVANHPRQLSLAIPPWVGAMSISLGWEGNRRSGVVLAMRHI